MAAAAQFVRGQFGAAQARTGRPRGGALQWALIAISGAGMLTSIVLAVSGAYYPALRVFSGTVLLLLTLLLWLSRDGV